MDAMRTRQASLEALLEQLPPLFPASHPLKLRPSADAFAPHLERFSGGHVARWFAALDGQEGEEPFADAHSLSSLEEGLGDVRIADEIRAEPDGYWVEPHWFPISTDCAGQHHMIDDHDGRVLYVAHDDDAVQVVAPSPEAWLQQLIDGHARGAIVWNRTYGLTDAAALAGREVPLHAQAQRRDVPPGHGVGVWLVIASLIAIVALIVLLLNR